jgi:hypothetical protein
MIIDVRENRSSNQEWKISPDIAATLGTQDTG